MMPRSRRAIVLATIIITLHIMLSGCGQYDTKDDPPTLIFHGTIDDVVPVRQSDSLKTKLDAFGIPNEYHRLKG